MKRITSPSTQDWAALCTRPQLTTEQLDDRVNSILKAVRNNGDQALFSYTKTLDGVSLSELSVSKSEFENAVSQVPVELKNAIQLAKQNIERFHKAQRRDEQKIETSPGVSCWRKCVPIEKVGLYIPGGSAPLFSTILMLGIPAVIAGCREIVMCTPPDNTGKINPAILYTAQLVGITSVYKIGGAQAIGAMAYGTESIPQVYKILGPGNQYVTKAKELVQQDGVAIDMPAGPSEVLIIADAACNPAFVAADLLSQAEHGADSQVVLLSDSKNVLDAVSRELLIQLEKLPRKAIATLALENSLSIQLGSLDECVLFSNQYAPEHLILATDSARVYAEQVVNAGSVFLGNYSCESAGDYASGTNHTLPTNGYARNYSGVSLDSFVRNITFQELTPTGIQTIGPAIEVMAEAENLVGHKNAVTLRLNELL